MSGWRLILCWMLSLMYACFCDHSDSYYCYHIILVLGLVCSIKLIIFIPILPWKLNYNLHITHSRNCRLSLGNKYFLFGQKWLWHTENMSFNGVQLFIKNGKVFLTLSYPNIWLIDSNILIMKASSLLF